MNEEWVKYFPGHKYFSMDELMAQNIGNQGTKQHIYRKTGNTNPYLGVSDSMVPNLISKFLDGQQYNFLFIDNFFIQ